MRGRWLVTAQSGLLVVLVAVAATIAVHRDLVSQHRSAAHARFVHDVRAAQARLERRLRPDPHLIELGGFRQSDAYASFADDLQAIHADGADISTRDALLRYALDATTDYEPVCDSDASDFSNNGCWWSNWPDAQQQAAARDAAAIDAILARMLATR